ncbi:hypothetical protein L1887_05987 [Cichorium endivia]|nr:hypothetical protein L1887_05987 [Cichorium endivia]
MARFTSMMVFNAVLLVVLVLSVNMTTTMGKACSDLIPIKPIWCHDGDVSEDCWDACRTKHGETVAARCFLEPLLPGNERGCKCFWPC